MTNELGDLEPLKALEIQSFLTRLPGIVNAEIVVGPVGEERASGVGIVRASVDQVNGKPVILLETEETLR